MPLCGKPRSSGSATSTVAPTSAAPAPHAALGQALVLDMVVLADVEVDVDRVLADDGAEQRGVGRAAGAHQLPDASPGCG